MRDVSKIRVLLKYWLPLLIWMGVIFSASSDRASGERSSRIIGPIVHWLFPYWPAAQVDEVVYIARKIAHLVEFAILAWLAWRFLRKPVRRDPRPWRWAQAGWALLWVVVYAASDEFHQLFVPSRQASVRDVVIDTCGGAAGLALVWALVTFATRLRSRAQRESLLPKPELQPGSALPTRPART
jgi:VanZ family protein